MLTQLAQLTAALTLALTSSAADAALTGPATDAGGPDAAAAVAPSEPRRGGVEQRKDGGDGDEARVFYGSSEGARVRLDLRRAGRELTGTLLYLYTNESVELAGSVGDAGEYALRYTTGGREVFSEGAWADPSGAPMRVKGLSYDEGGQPREFTLVERRASFRGPLRLETETRREEGRHYVVETEYPVLRSGIGGKAAVVFNRAIEDLVGSIRKNFLKDNRQAECGEDEAGCTLDHLGVNYEITFASDAFISVRFNAEISPAGAVHPVQRTESLNFDLSSGRAVTLKELFSRPADYEKFLGLCTDKLNGCDEPGCEGRFGEDAAASYSSWNVTEGGVVLTFDAYVIASYGDGEQAAEVRFAEAADLFRPEFLRAVGPAR